MKTTTSNKSFKPRYRWETDEIVRDITQKVMVGKNFGIELCILKKEKGIDISTTLVREIALQARKAIQKEIHKQLAKCAGMEPVLDQQGFMILK